MKAVLPRTAQDEQAHLQSTEVGAGAGRPADPEVAAKANNPIPASKRPSRDAWLQARQRWESDPKETFGSVARIMGVTRTAVSKRASLEAWARPANLQALSYQAQLLADGEVAPRTPNVAAATRKTSEQAAVMVRVAVLERHRADWVEHRSEFPLSQIAQDFEVGKQAKISAEMLMLRQRGEREAYGIESRTPGAPGDGLPLVTVKDLTGRKYT